MQEQQIPGFKFIALIAFLSALVAMSIDTMLPALGTMAHDLGVTNENDRQYVIFAFFAGNMVGIPVFGPLSDSRGRRPAIFGGLALFILGALACAIAGNFTILMLGRLLQGFGAAAPRIVALAMVRDGAKGAAMARIMSFVMSVFMLVPVLAPSIGQLVLYVASWRVLFVGLGVAAVIGGLWLYFGQEETLRVEARVPFSAAKLMAGAAEVLRNRISLGYTLATGVVFGLFTAYLATCQQIYAEQYHQGDKFPLWFGAMACFIAIAMLLNGRLVMSMGMRRLSRLAMFGYMGVWFVILALGLIMGGQPPLLLVAPLFAFWFFTAGFTFGNFNAMAMEPMGHIAGMAAAVSGALSQGIGIVLGALAGHFYDGGLTKLSAFFCLYAVVAFLFIEWAEKGRKPKTVAVI